MPEETVGEMYTKISADVKEFESDIDLVYDRLDKLEDKDISLQAETRGVENSVSSLGDEMMMLGGSVAVLYHFLERTSGGLQAMTSMATGLIGAAIDTYLVTKVIPGLEELAATGGDVNEVLELIISKNRKLAEKFDITDGAVRDFITDTLTSSESVKDLEKDLEPVILATDEFGNTLSRVGDELVYNDGDTDIYIGSIKDLNLALNDLDTDGVIVKDLIGDIAGEADVAAEHIALFIEEGSLESLWAMDPGLFPGTKYINEVAAAAEAAVEMYRAMLLEMGFDEYDIARAGVLGDDVAGPISKEQMDSYYDSGGD